MITRQDIAELARFEATDGCAISFYYQPPTPQDKSHRGEAILVKDLVREALRMAERQGKNGHTRPDLERIQLLAEHLHGNNGRAKAVFACSARNVWHEFDIPARLAKTELHVNRRFHLRPLSAIADVLPRVGIALADRTKARILELWMDNINELDKITWELPSRGRSDGFAGFDGGHAERKVDNEAMHNFKELGDRLKERQEARGWEKVLIGCRDETWHEIEPHLHSYTRQRLIGHFGIDPAAASVEQVREQIERIIADHRMTRVGGLIREVVGESKRDGRGALGLKHVVNSIEKGEVQTLLIGRDFKGQVSECHNCGHMDVRMVKACAVCGGETVEVEDVSNMLLAAAVRNGIEIVHVPIDMDPDFTVKGGIGALLRFRADHNTNEVLQKVG
jgi:peptide subunit release factor 1 (eRF1)